MKARVAILIVDKVSFRTKKFNWDRDGHHIISVRPQEVIAIQNMYATNDRAAKYMKKKNWKKKGKSAIVVGDLNTSLRTVDRTTKWKMIKGIEKLKNTISQHNPINLEQFAQQKQNTRSFQIHQNIYQDRTYPGPENEPQ